uniref:Fructose-bisphosphate aldolase n=1 Tax=Euglena gracilis TaxID=3039 RepID=Q42728_EUGGR|nr:fructose-1,6-bisphosphate aldolase [Euglena gracilis]
MSATQLLGGYQTISERTAPQNKLAVVGAVAVIAVASGVAAGYALNLSMPPLLPPCAPLAHGHLSRTTWHRPTPAAVAFASASEGAQTFVAPAAQSSNTFATSSVAASIGMVMGAGAVLLARMNQKPVAMNAWTGSVYGVLSQLWRSHGPSMLMSVRQDHLHPWQGILAADESRPNKTCGARLKSIGVENTEENVHSSRSCVHRTWLQRGNILGVIMYEETLYQKDKNGKPFVQIINEAGAVAGVKVDTGIAPLPGADDEGYTMGLDGLRERCQEYYRQGARFAKWRAVLRIDSKGLPSDRSILANATGLAQYAAICQECGLVPIVEPEILMDGDHDIETAAAAAERVLVAVYDALATQGVLLEGTLLKPNMVTPGVDSGIKATPETLPIFTCALLATVPAAVAGISFLSGGSSEEDASLNLNAINAIPYERKPWALTFSFGRALQASTLKTWGGKDENIARLRRCSLSVPSQWPGKYQGSGQAGESLFVKGYKY